MLFFDLLKIMNPAITPDQSKIHLATNNGQDDPIDVYLADGFDEWQRWQTKRNFERRFVVSLISIRGSNRWLFAGVHNSEMSTYLEEHKSWYYDMKEEKTCSEMNGRMVVTFARPGRQSYLNADSWQEKIALSEIFAERISVSDFPGFKSVHLTKAELDLIVGHELESWRAALSSVAGVYLISDNATGQLYVGSAYGSGGIWQRWASYATSGHGGNVELRKLLNEAEPHREKDFRYSILEIADTHASQNDILLREQHWKSVLLSRQHGLNAN